MRKSDLVFYFSLWGGKGRAGRDGREGVEKGGMRLDRTSSCYRFSSILLWLYSLFFGINFEYTELFHILYTSSFNE